ncbi:MAG: SPOR domain-containing protein [Acidobacteriota bacterium]
MVEYEEAGYYEIQLNNKQLVFFFMAAVAIAVVVFLCGVMVGRGVRDATIAAASADVLAESQPSRAGGTGVASSTEGQMRSELDYQKRLESPRVDERLEGLSTSPEKMVEAAVSSGRASRAKASSAGKSAAPSKRTATKGSRLVGSEEGTFTIQVVALKTQEAAQSLVKRLQEGGYRAYLAGGGSAGLHRVRVGWFASRAEAERVASQLRDVEKFKPYITQ